MHDLIKKLLPYCLRHKQSYILGVLVVVISNYFAVRTTVWIGRAVDYLTRRGGTFEGIWRYILIILTYVTIAAVAQYFTRIFLIGASRVIEYEFRNDFFKHLTRLSPSFYDRMKTGDIISRATSDVDNVRMALGPGIMYPLNTLNLLPMTVAAMIAKNGTLTAISFIPMILVPFLVQYISNIIYKRSLAIRENFSNFSGRIQDSISGIRVIKAFVQSRHELEVLDKYSRENVRLNMALAKVQAVFFPMMIPLFRSGMVDIIWIGGRYVVPAGITPAGNRMTKGDLIAFVMLYANLFWPVMSLGWVLSIYQRASASMHRILLIWNQQPEIQDSKETDASLREIRGEIEFRNLTFSYPNTRRPSLMDISFRIETGKTLGIVGTVGSGKSTIASIISRLYDPPQGTVFIDSHDIRSFPLDVLRRSVGTVFQETYLFSESIEDNILFSAEDKPDRMDAATASRVASVEEDILGFPNQFQTQLGERGINLSGGQKQRVSLARAIATNPPILVLDDAFASIDTQTEERILGRLREVMRQRTTILMSHRISTVKMADEIIVLDDGRIIEHGKHEDLLAQGGVYADIFQRQRLEEAIQEEDNPA